MWPQLAPNTVDFSGTIGACGAAESADGAMGVPDASMLGAQGRQESKCVQTIEPLLF